MTRLMYDSVTPGDIPSHATMVGGFVDGGPGIKWSAQDFAGWEAVGAKVVRIATQSYVRGANVYDCERGDFTPDELVNVIAIARGNGENPSAYCSLAPWPTVRQAFQRVNIPEPPYWIADYDGIAEIPPDAVAKQYLHDDPSNPTINSGGHFDVSVVADYWPGVDPAPTKKESESVAVPIVVPSGKRYPVGAIAPGFLDELNLTVADDQVVGPDGSTLTAGLAVVDVYAYDYTNPGTPIGSVTVSVEGNVPNVRGPIQQVIELVKLGPGNLTQPFNILVINHGPSDVYGILHHGAS